MDNKKWIAVAGGLLLACVVVSAILLQQRNEARQSWYESRDQVTDLNRRNVELIESLENQKSRFNTEMELAKQKQAVLTAAETQVTELKTQLNESQAKLDTFRAHINEANNEAARLEKELASTEERIAALDKKNQTLHDAIAVKETLLSESQDSLLALQAEADGLRERIAEMETAHREMLTTAEIQVTQLKAQLNERQVELENVRTQLQQANGETARLQKELVFNEERIANLANEHNKLEEERKTLASRFESMACEDMKRKTTIAMLKGQVEEQNKIIAALDKKNQSLRETVAVKEKQLSESQNSLLKLQAEATGLRERLVKMETEHREALTGQDEKITTLSSALEGKSIQLDFLEKEKGLLVSKLSEANNTITGLRNQLQEVIAHVPALKERLEQSLKKYQAIRENLIEAKTRQAELGAQKKAMRETYEALVTGLKQQLNSQEASIEEYREKLKVTFVDRILFGFSQVRISSEGKAVMVQLAGVLANVPEGRISIIGHADSIPIASKFHYRFPSNWEFSSARAAAVARYLLKQGDLEPSRIEVVGLSHYQPVADNDTDAGRAKNRRVEIVITPERYLDWESR